MQNRRVGAFYDNDENEEDENEILHNEMRRERMRMMLDNGQGQDDMEDPDKDMQNLLDFEEVKGPLSQWLRKKDVIKFVTTQFNNFLRQFSEPGKDGSAIYTYEEKIHDMCLNNRQSLEVVFSHLSHKNPNLAIWLAEEPALMLPILNSVALELVTEVYPDYQK